MLLQTGNWTIWESGSDLRCKMVVYWDFQDRCSVYLVCFLCWRFHVEREMTICQFFFKICGTILRTTETNVKYGNEIWIWKTFEKFLGWTLKPFFLLSLCHTGFKKTLPPLKNLGFENWFSQNNILESAEILIKIWGNWPLKCKWGKKGGKLNGM